MFFPFNPPVFEMIDRLREDLDARGYEPVYLTEDAVVRKPKLHLKTQMFLSKEVVSTLVPLPGWRGLILEYVLERADQIRTEGYFDVKNIRARTSENAMILVEQWEDRLAPGEEERTIFYLTVGSQNQNYRSMIMDGEVTYVVADIHAMVAYLDFVGLLGTCTWIDSVEQLEELLPKYGGFWYRFSRYAKFAF
jgi:hypothetical protein